jgi:hypothetical protein
MNQKTEGTLVLDGLLEGRLPPDPKVIERVRAWIDFAARLGLRYSLETDLNSFSILADDRPISVAQLRPDPARCIADALDELLKVFPEDERAALVSTIRSEEYRPGVAVRTLYVVGGDGTIQTREEQVEASTVAPPRQMSRREKLKLIGIGIGVAALLLAVSALFVDYPALFGRLREAVSPLDAQALPVDLGPFAQFFAVETRELRKGGRELVLTLKRTDAFPRTTEGCQRLIAQAEDAIGQRLAIEALARGYIRCEMFDKEGHCIGFSTERIAALRHEETVELALPLPRQVRLARLAFTY